MITKPVFIAAIEALHQQTIYDKQYAATMSIAMDSDVVPYKNDMVKVALVELLQAYFPPVDGHCAIQHYCWTLNFGKCVDDGCEVITAEDLWDEVILLHYSGGKGKYLSSKEASAFLATHNFIMVEDDLYDKKQ
jgi:hypothetical protein